MWLSKPGYEFKQKLMRLTFTDVVIPTLLKLQAEVQQERARTASIIATLRRKDPSTLRQQNSPPIIFMIDGEASCLEAAMTVLAEAIQENESMKTLHLVKLAASCSKSQQPCDVSPIYRSLKALLRHWREMKKEVPRPAYMEIIDVLLAPIAKASRDVFTKFFNLLGELLREALNEHNILKGWRIAGLAPFSHEKILRQNPTSEGWSQEQMDAYLTAIAKLAPRVAAVGQLTDAEIAAAVGEEFATLDPLSPEEDTQGKRRRRRKHLHEMAVNRRRALLVSHATILHCKGVTRAAQDSDDDDEVMVVELTD